jgi:hypothetical protein
VEEARILAPVFWLKKSRHMDWIIRKVTEIQLHPNSRNREDGFSLSKLWKPLIHNLKK